METMDKDYTNLLTNKIINNMYILIVSKFFNLDLIIAIKFSLVLINQI